jgi:hypothetical protein
LERAFVLAVMLAAVGLGLAMVQGDDGLRHVGLAFAKARSWGDVYPFSYFQVFSDYDPWGGYDLSLRWLASLLAWLPLSVSVRRFLALKLLAIAFVSALLWLTVRRARIPETVRSGGGLLLALGLSAAWLAEPVLRALLVRPFAFGTLLLLYSVGQSGALRGLVSSGAVLFMYPYLGFIYTVPVAIAHAFRGSRSFAAGTALATAISFGLQPRSFYGLFVALLRSDSVRSRLPRHLIFELVPMTQHLALAAVVIGALLLLLPHAQPLRRLRVEHVLMLLFAPVSLKYVRYFLDVEMCMAFVAYGADGVRACERALARVGADWARMLGLREPAAQQSVSGPPRRPRLLRPLLAAAYVLVGVLLVVGCVQQYRELAHDAALISRVPPGSVVLTGFNEQYRILYNRPDLSLVPSCEIGFPRPDIESVYLAYFNRGRVCALARAISARYFLDARTNYLDPLDIGCLHMVREDDEHRLWRVEVAQAANR